MLTAELIGGSGLRLLRSALIVLLIWSGNSHASAKPPIEAFSDQPRFREMKLSPDGTKIAFVNRGTGGSDLVVVQDLETKQAKVLGGIADVRVQRLRFLSNQYVVIRVSASADPEREFQPIRQHRGAFAIDIDASHFVALSTRGPDRGYLSNIIGVSQDGAHAYVPMRADWQRPETPRKIRLSDGEIVRDRRNLGTFQTIDWLMGPSDVPIVREDYSVRNERHEIVRLDGSTETTIYSQKTSLPLIAMVGIAPERDAIIVTEYNDAGFMSLSSMSMETGDMSPLVARSDQDIDAVIIDDNRVVYGVRYAGMTPSYEFFDAELNRDISEILASFGSVSVFVESWSADWAKLVLLVEGGADPQRYFLFDRTDGSLSAIANVRPDIETADVGEVTSIDYDARDGLKIPALLTWPAQIDANARRDLPLVVLPHGGPEAFDQIGFDWLAQFLANEGYAVFQPNFRGSAGLGSAFRNAGHGEWGRKVQHDITDGVKSLIELGWIDKDRICAMGWSYGGYAALAGGAFTPDLYQCIISIAGVSDLPEMMRYERRERSERSLTYKYWVEFIGDPQTDRERMQEVSPALHAANFEAPVLLIHGTHDTVVPTEQSELMGEALRKAGKDVTYLEIDGDVHSLVDNGTRRRILETVSAFLAPHLTAPPE